MKYRWIYVFLIILFVAFKMENKEDFNQNSEENVDSDARTQRRSFIMNRLLNELMLGDWEKKYPFTPMEVIQEEEGSTSSIQRLEDNISRIKGKIDETRSLFNRIEMSEFDTSSLSETSEENNSSSSSLNLFYSNTYIINSYDPRPGSNILIEDYNSSDSRRVSAKTISYNDSNISQNDMLDVESNNETDGKESPDNKRKCIEGSDRHADLKNISKKTSQVFNKSEDSACHNVKDSSLSENSQTKNNDTSSKGVFLRQPSFFSGNDNTSHLESQNYFHSDEKIAENEPSTSYNFSRKKLPEGTKNAKSQEFSTSNYDYSGRKLDSSNEAVCSSSHRDLNDENFKENAPTIMDYGFSDPKKKSSLKFLEEIERSHNVIRDSKYFMSDLKNAESEESTKFDYRFTNLRKQPSNVFKETLNVKGSPSCTNLNDTEYAFRKSSKVTDGTSTSDYDQKNLKPKRSMSKVFKKKRYTKINTSENMKTPNDSRRRQLFSDNDKTSSDESPPPSKNCSEHVLKSKKTVLKPSNAEDNSTLHFPNLKKHLRLPWTISEPNNSPNTLVTDSTQSNLFVDKIIYVGVPSSLFYNNKDENLSLVQSPKDRAQPDGDTERTLHNTRTNDLLYNKDHKKHSPKDDTFTDNTQTCIPTATNSCDCYLKTCNSSSRKIKLECDRVINTPLIKSNRSDSCQCFLKDKSPHGHFQHLKDMSNTNIDILKTPIMKEQSTHARQEDTVRTLSNRSNLVCHNCHHNIEISSIDSWDSPKRNVSTQVDDSDWIDLRNVKDKDKLNDGLAGPSGDGNKKKYCDYSSDEQSVKVIFKRKPRIKIDEPETADSSKTYLTNVTDSNKRTGCFAIYCRKMFCNCLRCKKSDSTFSD